MGLEVEWLLLMVEKYWPEEELKEENLFRFHLRQEANEQKI